MVKKSFSDDTYTAVYDKHNLLNSKVGTITKLRNLVCFIGSSKCKTYKYQYTQNKLS